MNHLWRKAKKEFFLGVDYTKSIFGVKTITFEPEFQEKIDVLDQMELNVNNLLQSFQQYLSSSTKLIGASSLALDSLSNSFKPTDTDFYKISLDNKDLLQKFSQINEEKTKNQAPNNCITPLVEFHQHIRSLYVILDKAKKNKILIQSINKEKDPEEYSKREAKLSKYQTAFCKGCDILLEKQAAVFCGVFSAYQYDLLSLVTEIKTRLPSHVIEFPFLHLTSKLPTLKSALDQNMANSQPNKTEEPTQNDEPAKQADPV